MPIYTFNNNYNTHFAHTNSKASCLILYRNSLSTIQMLLMQKQRGWRHVLQTATGSESEPSPVKLQTTICKVWSRNTEPLDQHDDSSNTRNTSRENKTWVRSYRYATAMCVCQASLARRIFVNNDSKEQKKKKKKRKYLSCPVLPQWNSLRLHQL